MLILGSAATSGAKRLVDPTIPTVADPVDTDNNAATTHPNAIAEREKPEAKCTIASPTPESSNTCPNAPPPAIINKIPAIGLRLDPSELRICFVSVPRAYPSIMPAHRLTWQ